MGVSVLLVNPNQMKPAIAPLGLEYLAEALDIHGLGVEVLDLCFEPDAQKALASAVDGGEFGLVGITVRNTDDCYLATQQSFIPHITEVVGWVREYTNAPVVLGGSGFSVSPSGILRRTGADFGVVGDGEIPLVRLANCVAEDAVTDEYCAQNPGLAMRRNGTVIINPPTWESFGQLPLRRRWLDNKRYFAEGGQAGIETKRGCPRKCIYCGDRHSKGRDVRTRPAIAAAREIMTLLEQGIDYLHTCDSEFNIPGYHAEAVSRELIRLGLADNLHWYAYCTPRPFTAKMAQAMAQAGCVGINFGADNGDERILQRLGRWHRPDDIRNAAKLCKDNGIACMFDLLLGGPGETEESVRATIELMKELEPDCVGVAVGIRIYPGTPMERIVRREGYTSANPNLRGQLEDNDDMVMPVFYLTAELGDGIFELLKDLIGDDRRFFFGGAPDESVDYNYSDHQPLVEAIRDGARGAYWDILRKMNA